MDLAVPIMYHKTQDNRKDAMEYGIVIEFTHQRTWHSCGSYTDALIGETGAITWLKHPDANVVEVRRIYDDHWAEDCNWSMLWYLHGTPNVALRLVKPQPEPELTVDELKEAIDDILDGYTHIGLNHSGTLELWEDAVGRWIAVTANTHRAILASRGASENAPPATIKHGTKEGSDANCCCSPCLQFRP